MNSILDSEGCTCLDGKQVLFLNLMLDGDLIEVSGRVVPQSAFGFSNLEDAKSWEPNAIHIIGKNANETFLHLFVSLDVENGWNERGDVA